MDCGAHGVEDRCRPLGVVYQMVTVDSSSAFAQATSKERLDGVRGGSQLA